MLPSPAFIIIISIFFIFSIFFSLFIAIRISSIGAVSSLFFSGAAVAVEYVFVVVVVVVVVVDVYDL